MTSATEISHTLTSRRIAMLVAIAATGMVLSLGTRTPVYGWLYHVFPPMQGLRAAARFGNLFLLGMAVLSAFGMVALRSVGREIIFNKTPQALECRMRSPGKAIHRPNAAIQLAPSFRDVGLDRKTRQRSRRFPFAVRPRRL